MKIIIETLKAIQRSPISRLTIPNPPSVKKIAGEGGEGGPNFSPLFRELVLNSEAFPRQSQAIAGVAGGRSG